MITPVGLGVAWSDLAVMIMANWTARASLRRAKEPGARKLAPWETRPSLGAHKTALCPGSTMRENPLKKRPWGGSM